jgi:carbon monoxide dehydrogenase subunit G
MLTLNSKKGKANGSQKVVYDFLTDFRNFSNLMPSDMMQQVVITDDTVRFSITGLGNVGLKISERQPNEQLVIKATEDSAADFTFHVGIAVLTENTSQVDIALDANLNMFLEMMARSPLQQFLDLMADKIETIDFTS